jgi:hypothetical protein
LQTRIDSAGLAVMKQKNWVFSPSLIIFIRIRPTWEKWFWWQAACYY